jgi:tryptophanyl-tRNA synthetase
MIKHVVAQLAPSTEKRAALAKRPQDVEDILTAGNQAAQRKASETMSEVRKALGL